MKREMEYEMSNFRFLAVFFLGLFLISCAATPKEEAAPTPDFAPPTPLPTQISLGGSMAVILVEEGKEINIYLSADEESAVVGTLPANDVLVQPTGREELNGDTLWVEIHFSPTEAGWIQERYLTEYLLNSHFCMDSRIPFLLENIQIALENKDGELFSSLISPVHGLDLRYYRYGTLANYTSEEAAWAFKSDYAVNWGNEPRSGFEKIGTFREIPLPMLLEVFSANYELYCNDAGTAASFAPEPWPLEYRNINFYTLFKPGTEQYGGLDWRSWLVGVEYVEDEPYLFALIHFQWEP
jgi:hypothetical protein